jgi:hypothetical protein
MSPLQMMLCPKKHYATKNKRFRQNLQEFHKRHNDEKATA